GRSLFPEDVELLLHEGLLRQRLRDYAGAESCFRSILALPAGNYLVGLDLALRGYKTRHALAELYFEQRRWADAETEWRTGVAGKPGFSPAWLGLGEIYLACQQWPLLEQAMARAARAGGNVTHLRSRMEQARNPPGIPPAPLARPQQG